MTIDLDEKELVKLINLVTADMVEQQKATHQPTPFEVELSRKLREEYEKQRPKIPASVEKNSS